MLISKYQPILPMVKFSDLFGNKSLGGSARRYLAPLRRHFDTLLTSVFVSTTLDGVTSLFSRQQRKKCIYFIVSGEMSVYLVKIKVVSITSELISYHFTSD